jgi:hypothetical protein
MNRVYVANGHDVVLDVAPGLIAVRFRDGLRVGERALAADGLNLMPFQQRFDIPGEPYTVLVDGLAPPEDEAWRAGTRYADERMHRSVAALVDRLTSREEVVRSAPVFRLGRDYVVATHRILVGFRAGAVDPVGTLAEMGYSVESWFDNEFCVRVLPKEDPLVVSASLRRRTDVLYAEPDFVVIRTPLAAGAASPVIGTPGVNDPFAPNQYALTITHADEVLARRGGSPDVKIAILDGGIDTQHEDLRDAFEAGIDAITGLPFQVVEPADGHGTACAGLAAGVRNNALGVCGVGAGCRLLAVKISRSSNVTIRGSAARTSDAVRGINAAVAAGAAIISLSWVFAETEQLTRAIDRARLQGRGTKGCVVVAGAGDSDTSPVGFPASLPGVLAVAASNQSDMPKTHQSNDGERNWGSCFGNALDIAAPGVANYTTDVTGPLGFGKLQGSAGNYISNFNGTSSAVPIVAGAAGLVLSANSNLTEQQVRDILCRKADKVGGQYDDMGHNLRMGFGRLNVARAVEEAVNMHQQPSP